MSQFIPRKTKRTRLFLPLILITSGFLILTYNLGTENADTWGVILKIWPLLFIYFGLEGLAQKKRAASNMFWITFGFALLLSNFAKISWSAWEIVLTFWPVLLVSFGIDLLFSQDTIWQRMIAGLLAVSIMGAIALIFDSGLFYRPLEHEQVDTARGNVRLATIALHPSMSILSLNAQGSPTNLVEGTIEHWAGEKIQSYYETMDDRGYLELKSSGMVFIYEPGVKNRADWNIRITSRIPVILEIDQIIGEQKYDLSGLEIMEFNTSLVIGKTLITLPALTDFQGKLSLVLGEIVIEVPKEVAFRLEGKPILGNVQVPASYQRVDNFFTSPGFDQAEYRIELELDHIIGQVIIRQR
jgi:hypothetical protein